MNTLVHSKALSLATRCKIVQIGSVNAEGWPCIKAMLQPRKQEGLNVFYHSTNTSSLRVDHFRNSPKACLYFYDSNTYEGLMLQGTMEILTDAATKKMIWRQGDEQYYSKGVTDPDYCVLRFTSHTGRYYENFASTDFSII